MQLKIGQNGTVVELSLEEYENMLAEIAELKAENIRLGKYEDRH